jgi:hypothetical protein
MQQRNHPESGRKIMTIGIDAQVNEVKREIAMRKSVYARRVEAGKMSRGDAAQKIETMQAVVASLEEYRRLMEAQL